MNVVADMLLTEPAPIVIWATLLVLSFPAVLLLGNPEAMRHPRRAARDWVAMLRERGEQRRQQAVAGGHHVTPPRACAPRRPS